MADMDTDRLDGVVVASMISTTGRVIMWQVNLGQRFETETWADYKLPGNLRIDAAYMTEKNVQSCWSRMGQYGPSMSIL